MARKMQTSRLSTGGRPVDPFIQWSYSSDDSYPDSSDSDSSISDNSSVDLSTESSSPRRRTSFESDSQPFSDSDDSSTTPDIGDPLMERVAQRPLRYRPGPLALSEIRPMRKQTALVKANLRFENFVDRLVHEFAEDMQRHVREFYLRLGLYVPFELPPPSLEFRKEIAASVVADKRLRAFYKKRKTITTKERQLTRRIRGKPFFFLKKETARPKPPVFLIWCK